MKNESPLRLLEIEKELAGPDAAAALKRYDAVLVGLEGRIEAALAGGLPPGEYEKCERLKEANTVARKVMRLVAQRKG
ncbi:MAG: hypothetical protein II649_00295 [Kiritimatiellae bacterium]|nr:hypothetical protein [Kiritimatiellia bacterium]